MHRNCQTSAGLDLRGHAYPYRRSAESTPPRADACAFTGLRDPQPIRDRARRPLKKVRPRIAPRPEPIGAAVPAARLIPIAASYLALNRLKISGGGLAEAL